jgi:hypothetical protein
MVPTAMDPDQDLLDSWIGKKSYANDWGQAGIKLDIPETGVSLTELDDFLREKLGHDTHITGEIVRTASGVTCD